MASAREGRVDDRVFDDDLAHVAPHGLLPRVAADATRVYKTGVT